MERFLYGVDQAAEALSLSPTKVRELIRAGKIEIVREGRRVLMSHAALQRYVESLERKAARQSGRRKARGGSLPADVIPWRKGLEGEPDR